MYNVQFVTMYEYNNVKYNIPNFLWSNSSAATCLFVVFFTLLSTLRVRFNNTNAPVNKEDFWFYSYYNISR